MSARSAIAVARHRVLGVAFLVLLLFFGWATYAVFTKKFVDYVPVTLRTSSIGLQLPALADVKIRGVIVGDVRTISSDGKGATLHLAIDPSKSSTIPENVTARILPKTLFGEKFVALQMPQRPSPKPIAAGDVIDESHVAIEVEKILNDIYPLLRTVQPEQLNYTLTAIADALDGRGEALGQNLSTLDSYLKRTNPQIPLLVNDLRKLGTVADTYREVAPQLSNLLRNSVTTGHTLEQKQAKVKALFDDVASFSSTSRDFLEQNGDNIIRLSKQGQAQLPLLAKYSPEYPCLLQGMVNWMPSMEQAYRNYTLHITLETLRNNPSGYSSADTPRYGAHNGPTCRQLPAPPYSQANPGPQPPIHAVDDGVHGGHGKFAPRVAPSFDLTSGFAGTAAEQSVVDALAAPAMGVSADDVPDVAALLFGPLARGTEVSLR